MPTVFVTGGTGFVGSHAVELLLARGYAVRCLVRPHRTSLGWLRGLPVDIAKANLTSPSELEQALRGIDFIVHIAGITKARTESEYFRGNVETTRALLAAASKTPSIQRFVHISSLTVSGPSLAGHPVDEHTKCRPITTYGRSKLAAEQEIRNAQLPFPVVILRPPAVYGPRDTDILQLFRAVKYGIRPQLGGHEKDVSLIYAPELARAIGDVIATPHADGKTYNVSDPTPYRMSELLLQIARIEHKRTIALPIPKLLVLGIAALAQGTASLFRMPALLNLEKARDLLQPKWTCDSARIKNDIGFTPIITATEGLTLTWKWYRENRWI